MSLVDRSGFFQRLSFALLTLSRRAADRWAIALLVVGALFNLVLIDQTPLSLSPDEAHYWDWSRRLDYAYYSKGPLVALIIRFQTALLGDTQLAVRSVAVIFQLLLSTAYYLAVRKLCEPGISLILLLAFRSTLMIASIGLVTTTDPLIAVFWLLSLVAALRALESPHWWVLAGAFLGFAFLAKYTSAVLGLSYGVFLLFWKRDHLRTLWPYLGAAVAGIAAIPVLIWNSQNNWVNFAHNLGHITRSSQTRTLSDRLGYLGELAAAQLGLYGPVLCVLLIAVLISSVVRWSRLSDSARLVVISSVSVLLLCVMVSLHRRVYANWPLPGFLGLFLLLAIRLRVADLQLARRIVVATAINLPILAAGFLLFSGFRFGIPPEYLPTKRLVGWDKLAQHAQNLADDRSNFSARPIILAENYDVLSSVLFEMESKPRGVCAVVDDRRMNQYDVWGGWESIGDNPVLVILKHPEHRSRVAEIFSELEQLEPNDGLAIDWDGEVLRRFYFYRGRGYTGYKPPVPTRR